MLTNEINKFRGKKTTEIIEYIPNSVASANIISNVEGSISVFAFDRGEELVGKISHFEIFIQVIDGEVEIILDDKIYLIESGRFIMIPSKSSYTLRAKVKFKILATQIKSQYQREAYGL